MFALCFVNRTYAFLGFAFFAHNATHFLHELGPFHHYALIILFHQPYFHGNSLRRD